MRDVQPAIAALLKEGYSVPQIMRRMHVTKAQVQRVIDKLKQMRNVG